jgi:hypothetical protein
VNCNVEQRKFCQKCKDTDSGRSELWGCNRLGTAAQYYLKHFFNPRDWQLNVVFESPSLANHQLNICFTLHMRSVVHIVMSKRGDNHFRRPMATATAYGRPQRRSMKCAPSYRSSRAILESLRLKDHSAVAIAVSVAEPQLNSSPDHRPASLRVGVRRWPVVSSSVPRSAAGAGTSAVGADSPTAAPCAERSPRGAQQPPGA